MTVIGIDATALSTSACGGIGTSQYRTMRALAEMGAPHRFVLYAVSAPVIPFTKETLDLPWPVRLGSGPFSRSNIIWMQTGVNSLLAADKVEVFWGPRHLLPFRARDLARVATVHDFWHRYHPEQEPWLNRTLDRFLVNKVLSEADVVVAPSVATARDAARFSRAAHDKTRVVPWGVEPGVFRPIPEEEIAPTLARLGIRVPYVLTLDVFNPRKNVFAVLEAAARLPEATRRSLTVVGLGKRRKSASAVEVQARADALGLGERLCLPGDLRQDEVAALYSGALALVYPSLYEGFGLPVLEAMACGCPVIAADRSSLPEVAGGAAVLVDPESADAIAAAIVGVATAPGERARLVALGRARAQEVSWRATAEGMLAAFEQALTVRGRRVGARGRVVHGSVPRSRGR